MSRFHVRGSLAVLAGACALVLAGAAQAAVVFSDNMEGYANDAALQASWVRPLVTANGGSSPNNYSTLNFTPAAISGLHPAPASGKVLRLGNGIRWHDIGSTITSSWTLDVKALQSGFGLGQGLYVLNSAGTQGYGFLWDSSVPNNPPGNGHLTIRKFDNPTWQATDANPNLFNNFGQGTGVTTAYYVAHPVTGYAVTGGTNDATATFNTSTWADMAGIRLAWDQPTSTLTLSMDGTQVASYTDSTPFNSFSRIYLRGSGNSYYDNITLSVPEPTMLAPLAIGAVALMRRRTAAAK